MKGKQLRKRKINGDWGGRKGITEEKGICEVAQERQEEGKSMHEAGVPACGSGWS